MQNQKTLDGLRVNVRMRILFRVETEKWLENRVSVLTQLPCRCGACRSLLHFEQHTTIVFHNVKATYQVESYPF
jgi:hypothetical protein